MDKKIVLLKLKIIIENAFEEIDDDKNFVMTNDNL